MPKTLDQTLAETGRQNVLDQIRSTPGGYEKAVAEFNSTGRIPTFNSGGDVAGFVNSFQRQAFENNGVPPVQSLTEISEEVKSIMDLPEEAPEIPNLLETYQRQREELGLTALEAQIGELTAQEDEIIAERRIRTQSEIDKPQALGVIGGRVSEVERQQNERLDVVGRQKSRVVEQYKAGLSTVQVIMDLTQQDYSNAKTAYDDKFNRSIKMLDMVRGIQNDQKTDQQRAIDNARANLQIYMNTITSGNLDYQSLSTDQKLAISKLEVQSGLPVGFMSSLKIDPGSDILFTTTNEGVTQVGFRQADGSVKVESYGTRTTGGFGKQTEAERKRTTLAEATSVLDALKNSFGHVHPDDWRRAMSEARKDGMGTEEFIKNFSGYTDPNRGDFVASYGFSKKTRGVDTSDDGFGGLIN